LIVENRDLSGEAPVLLVGVLAGDGDILAILAVGDDEECSEHSYISMLEHVGSVSSG